MKMGNLNEEAWMNASEARLIGALIGLARATDGNTVRTEETGRLMRVGLAALTQGEQKEFYEAMVEKIHAEKRLLAPDCATCVREILCVWTLAGNNKEITCLSP